MGLTDGWKGGWVGGWTDYWELNENDKQVIAATATKGRRRRVVVRVD